MERSLRFLAPVCHSYDEVNVTLLLSHAVTSLGVAKAADLFSSFNPIVVHGPCVPRSGRTVELVSKFIVQ